MYPLPGSQAGSDFSFGARPESISLTHTYLPANHWKNKMFNVIKGGCHLLEYP